MSNLEIIENKISYIKEHLRAAECHINCTLQEIESNPILRSAVERDLYVVVQAVIDLAEGVVAYRGFRKPTTMREAFDILGDEKILSAKFAHEFSKLVGFRNALAHDYEDLNFEVIYNVLHNKLKDVYEFLDYVKVALKL